MQACHFMEYFKIYASKRYLATNLEKLMLKQLIIILCFV